jgi:hypothetical protein
LCALNFFGAPSLDSICLFFFHWTTVPLDHSLFHLDTVLSRQRKSSLISSIPITKKKDFIHPRFEDKKKSKSHFQTLEILARWKWQMEATSKVQVLSCKLYLSKSPKVTYIWNNIIITNTRGSIMWQEYVVESQQFYPISDQSLWLQVQVQILSSFRDRLCSVGFTLIN